MAVQRNSTIDFVKLAAAFGVVINHLGPSTTGAERVSHAFLLFAVPFFLLVSIYFILVKALARPTAGLADFGFDRMLVPYACWTCIYLSLRTIKYVLVGRDVEFDLFEVILFGGSSVQLYFIPLLVIFQALTLAVVWLVRPAGRVRTALVLALVVISLGLFGSSRNYVGFSHAPWSSIIYISLSWIMIKMQSFEVGRTTNRVLGFFTLAVLVTQIFVDLPPLAWPWTLIGPVLGYGVCAFALNVPIRIEGSVAGGLLACSYGIFLAHFGVLETLEFLAVRIGLVITPYSTVSMLLSGLLISGICVGFIALVRLSRVAAYLLLGERPGNERARSLAIEKTV